MFLDKRLQLRRDGAQIAQKAQADLVALHAVDCLEHVLLQQTHDRGNLVGGALPVLRGKGVDRQVLARRDPCSSVAILRNVSAPTLCPAVRGRPALLRPTTVAVHNNSDVAGKAAHVHLPRLAMRLFLAQTAPSDRHQFLFLVFQELVDLLAAVVGQLL